MNPGLIIAKIKKEKENLQKLNKKNKVNKKVVVEWKFWFLNSIWLKKKGIEVGLVSGESLETPEKNFLPDLKLKHILLDFSCVNYIDSQGIDAVIQVVYVLLIANLKDKEFNYIYLFSS